jgi:ferredoxin-NADP reductase
MARATVLGRLTWLAGAVVETRSEAPRVRSIILDVPDWRGHRAGQHVDVRLTAEDGYQAVRSYSVASSPEESDVTLTVERIDDGEVSPYLVDEAMPGDRLEVRGPIGGYFVWDAALGGPLMLIAGGSGIVPLMAMLRHRLAVGSDVPVRLLYSSRSPDEVIYRDELEQLAMRHDGIEIIHTYTRSQPGNWRGYARRIDESLLAETVWPVDRQPLVYVCGPTPLVEAVATSLVALGHAPSHVKTERFGPTGR